MKKKLLQLSNDFADQKIYVNLVRRLSKEGYKQIVYVPVKWENKLNGNRDDSIDNVTYHYAYILKRTILFKLQYHKKIKIILRNLEQRVNCDEIGLVHAHFLFSDGGVAYALKKKYNIPYIVSVRASDMFTFFPKMLHLRRFGNEIMKEAEQVIFINNSYKEIFKNKYLLRSYKEIIGKIKIIPNAIDDKWFNKQPTEKKKQKEIRLLYVGRIVKRKKLDIVIKSLKILNNEGDFKYVLEVVGNGDGAYMNKIQKQADENVIFHGQISEFDVLLEIYRRSHVFVMPSIKETFGLVYIEALSQGLPIIYCKNEGVDSFFENRTVGVAVEPNNVRSFIDGVLHVVNNYKEFHLKTSNASKRFNWNQITQDYIESYKNANL